MFEQTAASIAGLAFGLIIIGLILTITHRWKNGITTSTKTPVYMGLHYMRFLSWVLLGCVLGGPWSYLVRALALVLIPIIWMQARTPRPALGHMLVGSSLSFGFAFVLGMLVFTKRDILIDWLFYFEALVVVTFIPQLLIGNPGQIRRYWYGPTNGESRVLHAFVATNAAAWTLYAFASEQTWMVVCYGVLLLEELAMVVILRFKTQGR